MTVALCEQELAAKGFWGSKSDPVSVGTVQQDLPEHSLVCDHSQCFEHKSEGRKKETFWKVISSIRFALLSSW